MVYMHGVLCGTSNENTWTTTTNAQSLFSAESARVNGNRRTSSFLECIQYNMKNTFCRNNLFAFSLRIYVDKVLCFDFTSFGCSLSCRVYKILHDDR